MSDFSTEINRAIRQLRSVSRAAVPKATAQAVNKVTSKALSRSIRETSKQARIPAKAIRRYAKIEKRATQIDPQSRIRVRRNNVPAIRLASVRKQIGKNIARHKARGDSKRKRTYSRIRAGKHVFENAFLTRLSNGKWHIMRRRSELRYPIDLVAVPILNEITEAFRTNSQEIMTQDMPLEMARAMAKQIQLIAARRRS